MTATNQGRCYACERKWPEYECIECGWLLCQQCTEDHEHPEPQP